MDIKDEIAKRLFAVIEFYNENETAIKRMNNATGRNIINCVQAVKNSFKPLGYDYRTGEPKNVIRVTVEPLKKQQEASQQQEEKIEEQPTGILLTIGGTDQEEVSPADENTESSTEEPTDQPSVEEPTDQAKVEEPTKNKKKNNAGN